MVVFNTAPTVVEIAAQGEIHAAESDVLPRNLVLAVEAQHVVSELERGADRVTIRLEHRVELGRAPTQGGAELEQKRAAVRCVPLLPGLA